jgi:O-Antigen ligase
MRRTARSMGNYKHEALGVEPSRRLSFLKFLLRYPIFLLAFGPPIFRSYEGGIDVTKGNIDAWSIIQAGLLGAVAFRATWRLATAQSIFIPKQIRTILVLAFILGLLYLVSALYSTVFFASAAYSILYFLSLICLFEFIQDAYMNSQNWLQCLLQLRLIALFLLFLVFVVLIFKPALVVGITPGEVFRFGGGTIAPMHVICPMIAIISAHTFLYFLESRARSVFFFFVGFAGTLFTRSRAAELSLLLSLAVLGYFWAKLGRRIAYLLISASFIFILFFGMLGGALGWGSVWDYFNRGQNLKGIESASGRTEVWNFIIQYCTAHPWGMGYIAGFRTTFRNYYTLGIQIDVASFGNAHNTYLQVLADAGWLALAVYLIMLFKIVVLSLRCVKRQTYMKLAPDSDSRITIECSLLMLIFCLGSGSGTADYVIPLRATFYWQLIIIAIILGASARMIAASRARNIALVK